jgi:5-methylthioadenosine/S-adenosylhomocysteine deaminase
MVPMPDDVLGVACRGGAAAFSQKELIGSLEVGKKADIDMVDLNTPGAMPVHSPQSSLVYNASAGEVDTVIVDGQILTRYYKILRVDDEALLTEASTACSHLFERGGGASPSRTR